MQGTDHFILEGDRGCRGGGGGKEGMVNNKMSFTKREVHTGKMLVEVKNLPTRSR